MRQEPFDRVVKAIYERGMGTKQYKPRFGDDLDALTFLNNYGHNQQTADFSGDESLGQQETDLRDWD